jgi:hypothetical protein
VDAGMVEPMRHLSIAQVEQFARQELSPTEMRRLEAHLARCLECLDRVDVEANSIAALQMMDRMRKALLHPNAKRNRKTE